MEGKRGSECLLKSVSNIDFNPLLNRTVFPEPASPSTKISCPTSSVFRASLTRSKICSFADN
ncbi:hypothetical protein EFP53_14865 [Lacticaseibacillus paracasei]|nr:hypothetical protein [Lacticaseibacillus paracasei]